MLYFFLFFFFFSSRRRHTRSLRDWSSDVCSSDLQKAALDVANCTIRAPISGKTGSLLVRMGNLVKANSEPPLRSEEHTSELQSRRDLVCRLLLEKKKKKKSKIKPHTHT